MIFMFYFFKAKEEESGAEDSTFSFTIGFCKLYLETHNSEK